MRHIAKALFRPRKNIGTVCFRFCEEKKPPSTNQWSINKVGQMVKKAWKTTFPDEAQQVKVKFEERKKKALEKPKLTPQQLQKIQMSIPEERRSALVETNIQPKPEKKGIADRLIPNAVKDKFKDTEAYKKYLDAQKEMSEFKEDFKEYMSSKDNIVFNTATTVYSHVARGSDISRAIEYMKQLDEEFDPENIDSEATHLFLTTYQAFLKGDTAELDLVCGQQALDYFKSHINLYKNKKMKPKITKVWDHNPAHLNAAKFEEKGAPTFMFRIEVQEIYCFEDMNGKIVDGDESRLNRCVFEFGLKGTGKGMQSHGHNWEIVQIRKIQEVKMLV